MCGHRLGNLLFQWASMMGIARDHNLTAVTTAGYGADDYAIKPSDWNGFTPAARVFATLQLQRYTAHYPEEREHSGCVLRVVERLGQPSVDGEGRSHGRRGLIAMSSAPSDALLGGEACQPHEPHHDIGHGMRRGHATPHRCAITTPSIPRASDAIVAFLRKRCGHRSGARVVLQGYWQSYRAFHTHRAFIRRALTLPLMVRRAAHRFIREARLSLQRRLAHAEGIARAGRPHDGGGRAQPQAEHARALYLIGVQVRLGDVARVRADPHLLPSWDFYRRGMAALRRRATEQAARLKKQVAVGFVVTVGGSLQSANASNELRTDRRMARQHLGLSRSTRSRGWHDDLVLFTSTDNSPLADMAILQQCDGLVISSSSFGWWSAYLAEAPTVINDGWVVAPSHIYKRCTTEGQAFRAVDYYPSEWTLLPPTDDEPRTGASPRGCGAGGSLQ